MPANARRNLFLLAFGYFACYVPYSAITKALTTHAIAGPHTSSGVALLPLMTLASTLAMATSLTLLGWWRYARPNGLGWPRPNRWTLLSGLSTATILLTTTLAYTFDGVSLAFVMLVMRGGVLVIAPLVDLASGHKIRWFSWIALALSMASLANALATRTGAVPVLCAIDLAAYLLGYVVRLRLMAKLGKSHDPSVRRRYFVEEQMVAAPAALVALALLWLTTTGKVHAQLHAGFVELWSTPTGLWAILAGLCSQGTGIFGGMMLLDAAEASYCVPLNRAMSILGGIVAAATLSAVYAIRAPSTGELVGAALLCSAIGVLWIGPLWQSRRPRAGR